MRDNSFKLFLAFLEEVIDVASQKKGLNEMQISKDTDLEISDYDLRVGSNQLITRIRALSIARRLKPVVLNLSRMDDLMCVKIIQAFPILREWIHVKEDQLTFSHKITPQEAEQMFELVKSRYKPILLSDPVRPHNQTGK